MTGIFFFCNFLIGRVLGICLVFNDEDFAPRFAGRGSGVGQIRC
jgi:hypothetical protein